MVLHPLQNGVDNLGLAYSNSFIMLFAPVVICRSNYFGNDLRLSFFKQLYHLDKSQLNRIEIELNLLG